MIPIELREDPDGPGAAELRVTAEIDGRPYDLVLDTGGARSTLPHDRFTSGFAAARIGDAGGDGVWGPAAGGAGRVVAPTVAVGPVVVRDVVVDLAVPGSATAPVLGLDVLSGHRLELRPAAGLLGIDSNAPADRERPLRRSSRGHPHVLVSWGAVESTALFDTGASASVVDADFAREHPDLFEWLPEVGVTDGAGNHARASMARMAACRIGGRPFAASLAVVVPVRGIQRAGDPTFDLILGVPAIRQADWIIDLTCDVWGFASDSIW